METRKGIDMTDSSHRPPPAGGHLELHDYQKQAVEFLREAPGGRGLFLDMGLGKTAITLSALEPRHLPALVIAPKRVAQEVWKTEAALWRPDLKVVQCTGTPAVRKAGFESSGDIYICSRDTQADALPYVRAGNFKTLVLDELSGYKSKSSLRWKTANKMRSHVANCWGLTGTPTPNSLLDLWAQVALLDRGVSLGRSFAAYRQRYFYPASVGFKGYATSWTMVRGADVLIYDLISDFCLSMQTEGRIKLPPVTENTIEVTLPAGARRIYDRMKRDMVVEVQSGAVHSASNAAVMVGRLSQMTAGFLYPDVDEFLSGNSKISHVHSEKTRALVEIFEGSSSPLLVFYRFKAELEALKEALPAGVVHTPKDKDVFKRWNRGEVPVLAAHPAAIGHGLNLQAGGHTVVWMTLPWSTEEWDQANKRLARQGQQNSVVIHKIMAKNTIDGVIEARLKQKETTQDSIMNYLQEF